MALAPPRGPPGLDSPPPPSSSPSRPRPISQNLARLILSHRLQQPGPSNLAELVSNSLDAAVEAASKDPRLTLGRLCESFCQSLPKRSGFAAREDVLLPLLEGKIKTLIDDCRPTDSEERAGPSPAEHLRTFIHLFLSAAALDWPYLNVGPSSGSTTSPFSSNLAAMLAEIRSTLDLPGARHSALIYAARCALFGILSSCPAPPTDMRSPRGAPTHYDVLLSSTPADVLQACATASERDPHVKERGSAGASLRSTGKGKASDLPLLLAQASQRTLSMAEQRRLRQSLPSHDKSELMGFLEEPALRSIVGSNSLLALALLEHLVAPSRGTGDAREDLGGKGQRLERLLDQLVELPPTSRSYDFLSRLLSLPSSSGDGSMPQLVRNRILAPFLSRCLSELERVEERMRGEAMEEMISVASAARGAGGGRGEVEGDQERDLEAGVAKRMARHVEALAGFISGLVQRGYLEVGRAGEESATPAQGKGSAREAGGEGEEPLWIVYEIKAWALKNARIREASRLFSMLC